MLSGKSCSICTKWYFTERKRFNYKVGWHSLVCANVFLIYRCGNAYLQIALVYLPLEVINDIVYRLFWMAYKETFQLSDKIWTLFKTIKRLTDVEIMWLLFIRIRDTTSFLRDCLQIELEEDSAATACIIFDPKIAVNWWPFSERSDNSLWMQYSKEYHAVSTIIKFSNLIFVSYFYMQMVSFF